MNLFLITVCTVLISASQFGQSSGSTRLQVYYESLCPDSRRFIVQQLNPVMSSSVGKNVDLELIPYGKASSSNSNGLHFSCQHGNEECEGNKLHACAIKHLSLDQALKYIACSMSQSGFVAGSSCARQLGLDYSKLEQCQKSEEGSKLLAQHGEKTHALRPKMYYVPWIVFDGKWDEERMEEAQKDLRSVVCGIVGQSACTRENRGSRRARRVKRNSNTFNRRRRY